MICHSKFKLDVLGRFLIVSVYSKYIFEFSDSKKRKNSKSAKKTILGHFWNILDLFLRKILKQLPYTNTDMTTVFPHLYRVIILWEVKNIFQYTKTIRNRFKTSTFILRIPYHVHKSHNNYYFKNIT